MDKAGWKAERRRADAKASKAGEGRAYHHGELRPALLAAAEQVLAERGVEGITLRECARRAGVSHAAPAHHFGDVTGLLTAVATLAYETLTLSMRDARAGAPDGPERLRAIGRGYVAFARRHPARFRLMFRTERLNPADRAFADAARGAYAELEAAVRLVSGQGSGPLTGPSLHVLVQAWSMVHGFAHLVLEGQINHLADEGLDGFVESLLPALLGALGERQAAG